MANKFLKFFTGTDARSRVFLVVAAVAIFSIIIFLVFSYFGESAPPTATRVAAAPGSLQTVPGGQMTPEFYRAVVEANRQAASQAQISGGSAIPTLINVPGQRTFNQDCTVICGDENVNVADDINRLVKDGKLSQEDANRLLNLAKNNVSEDEYAAALNDLVRQGKLTPEQARALLDKYKKQHGNALLNDSGRLMDSMIKSGQLPLDVANQLLALQKKGVTPAEYAAELNRLVKEGKLSPAAAAQLLAQYTQQQSGEAAKKGAFQLQQMAKGGEITPDVAKTLTDLQNRNIPVEDYAAALNRLVAAGKMTPATAAKLLDQYKKQRSGVGAGNAIIDGLIAQGEAGGDALLGDLVKNGKLGASAANDLAALQKKGGAATAMALDLVRSGKLSPAGAATLADLQKRGASPEEYQKALDELVRTGQLSPEDAKKLAALYASGAAASPEDYQKALDDLVKTGKMADTTEADLAALQKKGGAATAFAADLVRSGKLSPNAAATLAELQKRGVSPEEYQKALDELVRTGQLSPEDAKKLAALYASGAPASPADVQKALDDLAKTGKLATQAGPDIDALQKRGGAATAYADDLVRAGKLSPAGAAVLAALQKRGATPAEYQKALDELVRTGQISPEEAQRLAALYASGAAASPADIQKALALSRGKKISPDDALRLAGQYKKLADLRDARESLGKLQANNASIDDYANELKRLVAAGALSPEDASRLLAAYRALVTPVAPIPGVAPGVEGAIPGGAEFAQLQQRLQAEAAAPATTEEIQFTAPPTPAGETPAPAQTPVAVTTTTSVVDNSAAIQERLQRIEQLKEAMNGQAKDLLSTWSAVPVMVHKEGAQDKAKTNPDGTPIGSSTQTTTARLTPALIKAGTILFAILDTTVDSDYPDTPVMATIIEGPFKGAKLLGKLNLEQDKDKISLNFTLMDMESWLSAKPINAFAIDPDTAKTVMASTVDYHYFKRYGAIMATSFITGYSNAITQAGNSTTGIFGTSTTHPNLGGGSRLAVGLGQIGTTLGAAMANYINIPNTVKVNSGVGLGILFMSEVRE